MSEVTDQEAIDFFKQTHKLENFGPTEEPPVRILTMSGEEYTANEILEMMKKEAKEPGSSEVGRKHLDIHKKFLEFKKKKEGHE